MSHFREFEKEAIRLLAAPLFDASSIEIILADAELVSYDYSGVGYFLTVRHPAVPVGRVVLSEPEVVGRCGDVAGGFLVFVEGGELMLECYTAGSIEVPASFRDLEVRVGAI